MSSLIIARFWTVAAILKSPSCKLFSNYHIVMSLVTVERERERGILTLERKRESSNEVAKLILTSEQATSSTPTFS